MKKTLALILAFALVFSTITVAFAEETMGTDAQVCADLGMLVGDGNGVTAAYLGTTPTRLQAAVMFLRLKGLEAEAKAFTGTENFADGNIAWAEGKAILSYLKANPQLGWVGDGVSFNPNGAMTAQAYYKVMLEALGYKQNTATVVGDFAYEGTIAFAASKGLTKVATVANFTVNDLAAATVEALKGTVKDTTKTLAATLVEAGKVDNAKAVAAGLVVEAPAAVTAVLDDATAVGNTVVEVEFEDDVDAAAAGNVANYAIEGLTINAVSVVNSDTVRLDTAAMTTGKLYTLTVGGKSVKFAGIAKVSGAPDIDKVESEDTEEVVITFTKSIDLATGTNVANYSIAGVEIAKAEVDGDEVTLTTVGLKNKTKYTVKVTNVKSVDGVNKKSDSESFTSKFDTAAPKIDSANTKAETNQRLKVVFNEEVTEESAENLANYSIKVDEKDGDALEIVSVEWDSDDEDFVYLVTEAMDKKEDYVLSVNGIVDQRKAANTMTRPSTFDFDGIAEDEDAPEYKSAVALSSTKILVTFNDDSRIDEDSATNLANYDLEDLDIDEISVVEDSLGVFRVLLTVEDMETGENYDLTVDSVADEFGNAIDEDDLTVRVKADDIGAVEATDAYAIDENTIVVLFGNEIDEDSAENIANYEIDNDLGAPTKAEFEKDGYPVNSVVLTVNDMVNGLEDHRYDEYDLTIDGVLDLSGNELYYELEVDTKPVGNPAGILKVSTATNWDTDAPELEDAEAVDTNVVALTFDEMVMFRSQAKLQLAVEGDLNDLVELTAADYNDDDTVVEFTYAEGLADGVSYSVYRIVYGAGSEDGGIIDMIGNPVLKAQINPQDFEFDGTDEDHAFVEVDSYYQKDGRQFEVTMEREVALEAAVEASVAGDRTGEITDADDNTWRVEIKGSDQTIVRLTLQGAGKKIAEDTDYEFIFADFLEDKHGYPVADIDENDDEEAVTILSSEYEDEDAPYIEEVVAVSRETIEITFNERVASVDAGAFTLKNYDLDETVTFTVDNDEATNGDTLIVLTVSKPLEARYEYELTIVKEKVADHAGIENDSAETFYFNGSNLQD